MSSTVRRELFFREFQVLRAKGRVFGKKLPLNKVLVKLRAQGRCLNGSCWSATHTIMKNISVRCAAMLRDASALTPG